MQKPYHLFIFFTKYENKHQLIWKEIFKDPFLLLSKWNGIKEI
jgi:hypothetical protein